MIDETTASIVARISALELLVTQLFRMLYEQMGVRDEWVFEQHSKLKTLLPNATTTSSDPAFGDHLSAETAAILEALLDDIEKLRARYKQL